MPALDLGEHAHLAFLLPGLCGDSGPLSLAGWDHASLSASERHAPKASRHVRSGL